MCVDGHRFIINRSPSYRWASLKKLLLLPSPEVANLPTSVAANEKHIVIMTFEYVSVIIDNFFTQTNHCVVSYQLFLSLFYRLCVLFHKMDGRLKRANNKLLHWDLLHYAFKTPSRRYMWTNWKLSIHHGLWLLSVWGGWQVYQGNRAPSSVELLWVYCILEILISKIKQILTYSVIIFSSKPKL